MTFTVLPVSEFILPEWSWRICRDVDRSFKITNARAYAAQVRARYPWMQVKRLTDAGGVKA